MPRRDREESLERKKEKDRDREKVDGHGSRGLIIMSSWLQQNLVCGRPAKYAVKARRHRMGDRFDLDQGSSIMPRQEGG